MALFKIVVWAIIFLTKLKLRFPPGISNAKLTSPEGISERFNDFSSNLGTNLADKIGTTECQFKDYIPAIWLQRNMSR